MSSWLQLLDDRPIVVVVAGSNGAGKSTFFEVYLKSSGLRFINADLLSQELNLSAYEASRLTAAVRAELLRNRESFIFETVFSDPVGDKLQFLKDAADSGYSVVLCFIGIGDAETSEERVAMRVAQGGHDVPTEKLIARFPRTLSNLSAAIRELPCVLIFDNENLREPFRHVAVFTNGNRVECWEPLPLWLTSLL